MNYIITNLKAWNSAATPKHFRIWLLFWAIVCIGTQSANGQNTNQIVAIVPDSAAQGVNNLVVTFTLDADSPPAPPANVPPQSVTIGTIYGTSILHVSQYIVTAQFNIPADEPIGQKDASVVFSTPNGTLTFSMSNGFTVISGGNIQPVIISQPQSLNMTPGNAAVFTITASGSLPLNYQWQRNEINISGADSASYTIPSVVYADSGRYRCIVTNDFGADTSSAAVLTIMELAIGEYQIVDTDQDSCYNNSIMIYCPEIGQAFYGQDSQIQGNATDYTLGTDGLTVFDNITGLTWQRSPDINGDGQIRYTDKLTWANLQAYPEYLNAVNFGGYGDWRLPTIKELYSLIRFNGTDPSGIYDADELMPFIDTTYFPFAYGDTLAGERIIDAQYASGTMYVSHIGEDKLFGVNFADGRIKGYGLMIMGQDKTFFVKCVRGNVNYGFNNFVNNGDSSITDLSTGLMWAQMDSRVGMNWQTALAWVQIRNSQNFLGHSDWRLPNIKELESIVDYTRAPDITNSPAISPIFLSTSITNEAGQIDYPYIWASTTHANMSALPGDAAAYMAFGRAMGYMNGFWQDVHGAGSQRSDPKDGDPADYPYGRGPQGDAIHIFNYVRLVRNYDVAGQCNYTPGDINNNGSANGIDVVYGVAYFKGGNPPPINCAEDCPAQANPFYAAGDVNGNCTFNGIDITFYVAYLKGLQPALRFCDSCPPAAIASPTYPAIMPTKIKTPEINRVIGISN